MKENGKIILLMDMEFIISQMIKYTMEVGRIKRKRGLVNLFGLIKNM